MRIWEALHPRMVALVLGLVLGGPAMRADVAATPPLPKPDLPFSGSGQLLTVWSWGAETPRSRWALAVTAANGTQEIALPGTPPMEVKPARARWLGPRAAVVEEHVLAPGAAMRSRLVRLDLDPVRSATLLDRGGLLDVSPDGKRLALFRVGPKGPEGLEVWSLDPLAQTGMFSGAAGHENWVSAASWDPASSRLAVAIRTGKEKLLPRLALLSGDLHERTWVAEEPDGGRETGGTVPLFWAGRDVYAATTKPLLRCTVDGGGCVSVYDSGEFRVIRGGVLVGERRALLIVSDQRADRFETRAQELHEFDLDTKTGRLLYRLPDDAFLSDIDWTE